MNKLGLGIDLFKVLSFMQGGDINPFTPILDNASEEVKKLGFKKVGLLGSIFIMNGEFFKKPFTDKGIQVITPKDDDKQFINRKISEELERGVVNEETLNKLLSIIKEMKEEENIDAVILGCSEVAVAFKGVDTPVPCIDIMKKQMNNLVNEILA